METRAETFLALPWDLMGYLECDNLVGQEHVRAKFLPSFQQISNQSWLKTSPSKYCMSKMNFTPFSSPTKRNTYSIHQNFMNNSPVSGTLKFTSSKGKENESFQQIRIRTWPLNCAWKLAEDGCDLRSYLFMRLNWSTVWLVWFVVAAGTKEEKWNQLRTP